MGGVGLRYLNKHFCLRDGRGLCQRERVGASMRERERDKMRECSFFLPIRYLSHSYDIGKKKSFDATTDIGLKDRHIYFLLNIICEVLLLPFGIFTSTNKL